MPDLTDGARQLVVAHDSGDVARLGADLFARAAASAIQTRGRFDVALSGGSTPRAMHTLLSGSPYRDQIAWQSVQFYWGDERCVPPEDADSNFRMAQETLLSHIPVLPEQIHRMQGELPPDEAAARYEEELRRSMGLTAVALPRFDLLFLGMGPDGHTLSLFPRSAALSVTDRAVTANYVPTLGAHRVTLTYPAANNAANVVFLVAGAEKADALAAVLEGPRDPQTYPSQGIAPVHGELRWIVDAAAAANLRGTSGGPRL